MLPPPIPDHQLIRKIGSGSYGEVWLGKNVMGTFRAIKIIYRSNFDDDRPYERERMGIRNFEPISRSEESQLDVLHVGDFPDGFYYIMELGDDEQTGQVIDPDHYAPRTLRSDLRKLGRIPFESCLELALSLTRALDKLHHHGLIHRDIKPTNIIFIHGAPKLADIGLVTSSATTMSFVGTEGYVPPEGPGTARADIYSLGRVLYECATGRDRNDFPELPTDLNSFPDATGIAELNQVIVKACAARPEARYQTAAEMLHDLQALQGGKSLIRLKRVERQFALVRRGSYHALLLLAVAAPAYFYGMHQPQNLKNNAGISQAEFISDSRFIVTTSQSSDTVVWDTKSGTAVKHRVWELSH